MVREILRILGKPESLIRFVADRPGHDRRYALDTSKVREELGWRPWVPFAPRLARTVEWYLAHRARWEAVTSGAYRRYAEEWCGRLGLGPAG